MLLIGCLGIFCPNVLFGLVNHRYHHPEDPELLDYSQWCSSAVSRLECDIFQDALLMSNAVLGLHLHRKCCSGFPSRRLLGNVSTSEHTSHA